MIGPVFLLLSGPLAGLTSPVRCAGALELFSILVVRASPSLAIGSLFAFLHAAAVAIAFGVFAELAYRASGSLLAAAALTTALGISRPFGNAFSPPSTAAAFGACTAVALVLYEFVQTTGGSPALRRSAIRVSATLVITAAIVPAWTVPCALIVFATAWRIAAPSAGRRVATATAAAFVVAATSMLVTKAVNATGPVPWTACVWSALDPLGPMKALVPVIDASGPLVLALGALGAYGAAISARGPRTAFGAGIAALATVSVLGTSLADRVVGVPIFVAVWYMAAAGIREMYTRALDRRAVVSVLLLAVVPLLQLSRARMIEREGFSRTVERDLSADARGSNAEGVSLAQVRRLLNLVPDRSTLVEEDASVDLLLRAAEFGRRPAKSLATVPARRRDVTAALGRGGVFAFPLGQRELSLRGFAIDVAGLPADSRGLARVAFVRPCVEITKTWVDLDSIGVDGRVSLVADAEPAVGPVVMYFSGENGYTPGPDGWPPEFAAGFALQMFDRNDPAHAARMDAEARSVGLQDHPVFAAPYVARLTLSRPPRAPLALPVVLGPPRAHGVGRLTAVSADAPPLTLCDAPSVRVSEFRMKNED